MSRLQFDKYAFLSRKGFCWEYALLSQNGFHCKYAPFWVCLVQTFTQTFRIWLRFCADIWTKNRRLTALLCHIKIFTSWIQIKCFSWIKLVVLVCCELCVLEEVMQGTLIPRNICDYSELQFDKYTLLSRKGFCWEYAILSQNGFCCKYAPFWVCLVQTFTQIFRIWLRFCADIWTKNRRLAALQGSETIFWPFFEF